MAQTDRLHSFRIRASRDDLAAWSIAARAAGLNKTAWLRSLAAQAASTARDPAELAAELARLRRDVSACGNNLNQIAHALNAGHDADPAPAIRAFENLSAGLTDLLNDARSPRRKGGSRR